MDNLCTSLGLTVAKVNQLLQNLLKISHEFSSQDQTKLLIDQIISIVSDLTHVSIHAKSLKSKYEKREIQAVECLQALKDVVQKQQEELRKLSQRPPTSSTHTDTVDLQQIEIDIDLQNKERYKNHQQKLKDTIHVLKIRQVQTVREKQSLKQQLDKCVLLLKAQQTLLEDHETSFAVAPVVAPQLVDEHVGDSGLELEFAYSTERDRKAVASTLPKSPSSAKYRYTVANEGEEEYQADNLMEIDRDQTPNQRSTEEVTHNEYEVARREGDTSWGEAVEDSFELIQGYYDISDNAQDSLDLEYSPVSLSLSPPFSPPSAVPLAIDSSR